MRKFFIILLLSFNILCGGHNDHLKFGIHSINGKILEREAYVLLHDNSKKIPLSVSYHLTRQHLQGTQERVDRFKSDPDLLEGERAELSDYKGSDYDRGHMAPAGDMKHSYKVMLESFYLLNVFPQIPGIYKLEEKLLEDADSVHNGHLIAYRMCKSPAMVVWTGELKKAISRLLKTKYRYHKTAWSEKRFLWAEIDGQEWKIIRNMIKVIKMHQVWKQKENKEVLSALGATRQMDWKDILLDGRLPGREDRLFDPLTDTKIYDTAISM